MLFGYLKKFGGIEELKWSMITEANTDVIYISRAMGLGVLASFFYLKNKMLKITLAISLIFCMLILNEIGPILAILLSVFAFYSRKNSAYLLMAIFLGIFFYFFVIEKFIADLTLEGVLSDPRVDIYIKNLNYFLNHPFCGIGIAGSANIVGEYQSAHNIFLEIAAEFGIIGLIPFLGMVVLLFDKFLKNKNFLFSYLWLYSFIVVQFSGDIALNTMFWAFSAIFMSMSINNDDNISIRLNI
ncbi:hypothetical protein FLJC2902T_19660 [Flavobacterium limnosediminis JC2902]|uniref:O-antigen ligase-related domain-containing protein n=1 Tax=Flavobacterium limnosediminis JC2902 TaxID=1341181 RepID=V6SKN7_9FLAO|nr:hypothetical protein FLJC2902T_19660 [Flavobacterium limnosediminis JC2902]